MVSLHRRLGTSASGATPEAETQYLLVDSSVRPACCCGSAQPGSLCEEVKD